MLKVYEFIDELKRFKKSSMNALDKPMLAMVCDDMLDDIANTDMNDVEDLRRIVRCTADLLDALYDECSK